MNSFKASILINASPNGYVHYQRGLHQGNPLSPLLFVLITDVLCMMFSNTLRSHILISVPLGEFRRKYNLHYMDDLLVLTTGGLEDLRIVKLILYVFKGMTSLATNFSKTCLYTSTLGVLPDPTTVESLSCERGLLSVTYLGIPIAGRRPRRQDWVRLILKIRHEAFLVEGAALVSRGASYLGEFGSLRVTNILDVPVSFTMFGHQGDQSDP